MRPHYCIDIKNGQATQAVVHRELELFLDLINNFDLELNEVVREYGPNNSRYGKPDGDFEPTVAGTGAVIHHV